MTGIPTRQLQRWTNPGATESPKRARNRIGNILRSDRSPLSDVLDKFVIRLQGSYKNSTTTHGNSDVDVLVRSTSAWYRDLSALSVEQEHLYRDHHSPPQYGVSDLRGDVLKALRARRVPYDDGEKAIAISEEESPLGFSADVVVCRDFRRYTRYEGRSEDEHDYLIQGENPAVHGGRESDMLIRPVSRDSCPNTHHDQ
jgi:hypothetical protein